MCEQRLIRQKDVSPAGSLGKEHCRGRERPGQRAEVGACLPVPGIGKGVSVAEARGASGREEWTSEGYEGAESADARTLVFP